MKSCFPSGLKYRHGSLKIPNFWCQVSHRLQINHPQHSTEATLPLSVPHSSCCALSLRSSGGSFTSQSRQEEQKIPDSNGLLPWAFTNTFLLFVFFHSTHSNTIIPELSYLWRKKTKMKWKSYKLTCSQHKKQVELYFFFLKLIYAWPMQTCFGRNRFWMHL